MSIYRIKTSRAFRKDVRRLQRSGHDMRKLQALIDILAADRGLPASCRDHQLHGTVEGQRGCHIGPDWLLLYRKEDDRLFLLLLRSGTHRDVLGIE